MNMSEYTKEQTPTQSQIMDEIKKINEQVGEILRILNEQLK